MNACKYTGLAIAILWFCGWSLPAQAARTFTVTQSPSSALAEYDMGTTQTLSYTVANTSGGGNICERIYEMRFRLPGTGTVFSSATAAPAGWTRTAFSATSVTFRANSWNDAIDTPAGGGKSCAGGQGAVTAAVFNLVMAMRTASADVTETLRDARASFTLDTNFADGIARTGRTTINNPGSWTLRALSITSVQTTDLSGNPVASIFAGDSFRLVISVQNVSNTTLSGINVMSLTQTKTGTWSGGSPSCSLSGTSPSPLNLAPGASGTITYVCSTSSGDSGSVTFNVRVRNSTGSATSRTVSSNPLSVSQFVADLVVSSSCAYLNQTFTLTMNLRNNSTCTLNNVSPTISVSPSGIVTLVSGPTPATVTLNPAPGPGNTAAIQWTYRITGGAAGQTYQFTGTASGTRSGGAGCSGTAVTPQATSPTLTRGGFEPTVTPISVNSSSTFQNVEWSITNKGCGNVTRVEITYPAGFTWNGDGYALYGAANIEGEPSGGNPAVFDVSANPIVLGDSGDFSLVLSTPPGITTPTSYSFDIGITESVTGFSTRSVPLTVNPFGTAGINSTLRGPWREEYR